MPRSKRAERAGLCEDKRGSCLSRANSMNMAYREPEAPPVFPGPGRGRGTARSVQEQPLCTGRSWPSHRLARPGWQREIQGDTGLALALPAPFWAINCPCKRPIRLQTIRALTGEVAFLGIWHSWCLPFLFSGLQSFMPFIISYMLMIHRNKQEWQYFLVWILGHSFRFRSVLSLH